MNDTFAQQEAFGPPQKKRSCLWTFMAIIGFLTLSFCCLCGVGGYFLMPTFEENPEKTQLITKEMLDIEIPSIFQPRSHFQMNAFGMFSVRGVFYERVPGNGTLVLTEVNSQYIPDFTDQIQGEIRKTNLEEGSGGTDLVIDEGKTTQKTVIIDGQEVPFLIQLAKDPSTNDHFRMVQGSFKGKSGTVILDLRVQEERWVVSDDHSGDEALIMQMLESIGPKAVPENSQTPATETPVTETPATETPATETPATETPATETPATETPATETPVTETPVTETPATETPATETPATETPAAEEVN